MLENEPLREFEFVIERDGKNIEITSTAQDLEEAGSFGIWTRINFIYYKVALNTLAVHFNVAAQWKKAYKILGFSPGKSLL